MKAGQSRLTQDQVRQLAEIAGIDPGVAAAEIEAQHARTKETREMWQDVVRRLSSFTPLAVLVAAAMIGQSDYTKAGHNHLDITRYVYIR